MELNYQKTHRYALIEDSKISPNAAGAQGQRVNALYQAIDLELRRTVAVKYIPLEGQNKREKDAFLAKAMQEVAAMIWLGEENLAVPRIYDHYCDRQTDVLYLVMEWIKGKTLATQMQVPEQMFLNWMIDLCDILAVMERKRIYHKDIKPANIMIGAKNKLYLIDFNISIAAPNQVEGTVHYKAPEMEQNARYQGREKVDMFSIGVLLYEYYTGKVPVRSVDYARNRSRGPEQWDEFIAPIEKNPRMSSVANSIVLKCMQLDPKQRYHDYAALKRELIGAKKANGKR